MKKPPKSLSEEDRIVWNRVASSINPLPGRKMLEAMTAPPAPEKPAKVHRMLAGPVPKPSSAPARPPLPHQHGIDRVTRRKIAKGRMTIDARIDLHGLVQGEAHAMLHGFLHRAHADGCRLILVITGKGSSLGSDGVLRRAIPGWLQTPQFRHMVSGFEEAARTHGGEGALYVRLRSRQP